MAVDGDEVEEYESDPDDAIFPSAMRRREASDDEDERSEGYRSQRKERTAAMASDVESDGQGAPPAYEEEEEEEEDVEDGEEFEEEDEIVGEEDGIEGVGEEKREDGEGEKVVEGSGSKDEEGEKKENEPYAVPTAGAFYMHDDRFQNNGRGRQRRMPGGRRLWESRDDHAWVHDRFEEMKIEDTYYDEGRRNPRGRFRGRGGGRNRGTGRGYAKSNRPRGYYDDGNNQNRAQKTVRGRGPRRYEPLPKNNEVPASQHKQSGKSQESARNTGAGRSSSQAPNMQPDPALSRKQVFASSLNSASPPFYPSGSSKQDKSVTQVQSGSTIKTLSSSMQMENNSLSSQSVSLSRGKSVVDSNSNDKLYINDSLRPVARKALASAQLKSSGLPLTSIITTQSAQSRVQGRSLNVTTPSNFQRTSSLTQVARFPQQIQPPVHQRQTQFQPALKNSIQQGGQQRPAPGSRISSPPHVPSINSSEAGEPDSPPGSSKSKTQIVIKGKTSNQGAARGSFLYNGAQVIGASGAMGLSHNDQNFATTPTLLPVMQFGGQHHGGLGVPAVGMALPGYVAQPQLGFGNSEMTWVPVLAGAAGALGASYPYIALDGSYYPRPSGQTSSSVTSRESSASKPANTLEPPQKPEIVNDEFGQRQNKPRRYSEMNFGQ